MLTNENVFRAKADSEDPDCWCSLHCPILASLALRKHAYSNKLKTLKFSDKNSGIFFIFLLETYTVGTHQNRLAEVVLMSTHSRNKKNNVCPCKPQFYYIKVGFKGVKIIKVCFCDGYYRINKCTVQCFRSFTLLLLP